MADLPLLLTGAIAALTIGAGAAQLGGPVANDWRAAKGAMKRRLLDLSRKPPGASARMIGAAILAATLAGGALAAYAAEPSSSQGAAPERLAAHAAGVMGSGDQLSLKVVEDGKERTLKPGQDYADGWKLDSLTPTSATLVKDGERREVGLNPTGALASKAPAAPPSQVRVALSDQELLDEVLKHAWDGKTPKPGLTLEQTRRYYILNYKAIHAMDDFQAEMNARALRAGLGQVWLQADPYKFDLYLLGAEAPEFAQLLNTEMRAQTAAAQAAFDRYGPVQIKVGPQQIRPGPDGQIHLYPELEQNYPGAMTRPVDPDADPLGPNVLTIRAPDPIEPRLYSTEANPPLQGVKFMYLPAGYKPAPGPPPPSVEGPEPPP